MIAWEWPLDLSIMACFSAILKRRTRLRAEAPIHDSGNASGLLNIPLRQ